MSYEEFLAALCIWREARGSSMAILTAIWWVIRNRASDAQKRWPSSIPGVIQQHAQFSSMTILGDPNTVKAPIPPAPGQSPSPDWLAWLNCQIVVATSLGSDPTGGATNYESIEDPEQRPAWCDPSKITLTLGPFRFYKL